MKKVYYYLYKYIAIHLPSNTMTIGRVKIGLIFRKFRYFLCRNIFEYCGDNVNIQKGAYFGYGYHIQIGDYSGLGINSVIPDGSIIGKYVMMGPNCYIHSVNHKFDRTDIPMGMQGATDPLPCIIDDDVWIGRNVTIMVGRHISKGTIVASNSVVTKDFPPYSIIGGNPAKLIRSRIPDEN